MGFSTRAMTEAEAVAIPDDEPPDLVALSSAPVVGRLVRGSSFLKIRVSGVEAAKFASEPPFQVVEGDVLKVKPPDYASFVKVPVAGEGDSEATASLQAKDPAIVAKAVEVVGDASDRMEAVKRLNTFVFEYVRKVPTIGIPNGLEVLQRREGDCNEHTALFVSLARAVGIPSRIAAGLVFSERLGQAFYYHAWPEVRFEEGWLAMDPTFGQFPADATHLKIVNGDLDRQIEIMGMIGRVKLEVVENW
jgi:transglutaminase-like putative cysteine protease